jgi:cephalosporin-C deacetylase-like acetyl esterase
MIRKCKGVRFGILTGLALAAGVMAGDETGRLIPQSGGGWKTDGLPYQATISAKGSLQALSVNGFDFLAPAKGTDQGFYLANGETVLPAGSASVTGVVLTVDSADARYSLRFLPARIELTLKNLGIADGHCGRLALNPDLARIKNPVTSEEYALPAKSLSGPMRLIASNGASLTLPGQYLVMSGSGYVAKLTYVMPRGPVLSCAFDIAARPQAEDAVKVTARAPNAEFAYASGDPQPFSTEFTNMTADAFRAEVVLKLKPYLPTGTGREMKQKLSLKKNEARTLTWTLEKLDPSVYTAEVWLEQGANRRLCASPRLVFNTSAMLPPAAPEDFDDFWKKTLEEQAKIPVDWQMVKVRDQGKSEIYKFSFAGLLGHRCYGYLTVPMDKSKKVPAILKVPSSGVHTLQPQVFAGDDYVGMSINIAWVDVDLPAEQYDVRTWPAPYLVTGILDKEYYSLRFSYAACVRAAELLAARPEVDPDNMLVTGSSQGGGLTLITAGLYPKFKAAVANVPALCRLDWMLDLQPPYFPIAVNADTRPVIADTLRYYDAVHFARHIRCPIWISLGLLDDVTPPMGVFGAFNVIPSTNKNLLVQPYTGHGGGWDVTAATKGVWP